MCAIKYKNLIDIVRFYYKKITLFLKIYFALVKEKKKKQQYYRAPIKSGINAKKHAASLKPLNLFSFFCMRTKPTGGVTRMHLDTLEKYKKLV